MLNIRNYTKEEELKRAKQDLQNFIKIGDTKNAEIAQRNVDKFSK
jgi:hypothetical protein